TRGSVNVPGTYTAQVVWIISVPDVARRCTLWDARSVPMTVAPRIPDAGTAHSAMPVWPPTGTQTARKPAGGFIDCPVDYLTLPWWLYQQGAMGFDTPAHYGPEELRRLLRAPRLAPVQEAVQRLEDLGLLAWSPQGIQFLPQAQALREALAQD